MVSAPRVVIDTNIWLSALYFSGTPAKVVLLVEDKKIISVTSEFILNELRDTMVNDFHTPSFASAGTVAYIQSISELVHTKGKDFGLRDPDDNKVLETAVVGKCQWLMTGDKDLLIKRKYNNIQIVTATTFLNKRK